VIDQSLSEAKDMFDHARQASNDTDPAVRAWADYWGVIISPAAQQGDLVQKMAQSDQWYERLLAVIAAGRLPDQGAAAASALSNDADPVVKDFASSVVDQLSQPPPAQPANP
jgi:hypothetical protein